MLLQCSDAGGAEHGAGHPCTHTTCCLGSCCTRSILSLLLLYAKRLAVSCCV